MKFVGFDCLIFNIYILLIKESQTNETGQQIKSSNITAEGG